MTNNKIITVYSTPDCAHCFTLKSYLQSKGIEFEDINIYEDDNARLTMEEISGQKNVPVSVINDEVVVGWDKDKIKKLLNI